MLRVPFFIQSGVGARRDPHIITVACAFAATQQFIAYMLQAEIQMPSMTLREHGSRCAIFDSG